MKINIKVLGKYNSNLFVIKKYHRFSMSVYFKDRY